MTQSDKSSDAEPGPTQHGKTGAPAERPEFAFPADVFAHVKASGAELASGESEFDSDQAQNRYAICLTPRSGSTYLAYLLRDTKAFGFPEEWLALTLIKKEAAALGAGDIATYTRRVMAKYASDNHVSGIEYGIAQLLAARALGDVDSVLDRSVRYLYLRRRNIVRQGISMHIALQSGVLHSYQLNDDANTVRAAVIYDTPAIRQQIKVLHDQELMWEREFGARHIEPERLYFEDLIERPQRVLRRLANLLGLPTTPLLPEKAAIQPLADNRADEWEARYRTEDVDYLEALKMHRPRVHIQLPMT
mgnify:FL=1|tara:strand:- start:5657 stop:6571 length:915 start_codon:yes stop_codon:yes gene_type:complete